MHNNNIFIFLDKFSGVISSLGLGCRFMVRNICFCLPGIIILMPHTAFAVTEPETVAAQHRAEITQRSGLGPLLLDQAENRPGVARVEAMGAKPLKAEIETPVLVAPCRDDSKINITGAPKLSVLVRESISSKFTGLCLESGDIERIVGDIERILGEITSYYINQGFVTTRAYLPPQDLSKGDLEILVVEGVVEKVSIDDNNAGSVSIGNAFTGIEGNVLNLRDLEQGIDQLNRLASNDAQLDIQPGAEAGQSIIVVRNEPTSRFHFNISTDNHGSKSTGKVQTAFRATADNLFGFNDMVSATHKETTPGSWGTKFSLSDSVNFSVPFGRTTLSLGTSRSQYFSQLRARSGSVFTTSGNNKTINGRLDNVIYRNQSERMTLAAAITAKKASNYLDGQYLSVSSRGLAVLDLETSITTAIAGGSLTLDIVIASGLKSLGAMNDPVDLPVSAPRAQFQKINLGFNFSRPFSLRGMDAVFNSKLTTQSSEVALYGSEQISIGGIGSVRGFVQNTLSGDNGYYLRNEFSVTPTWKIGEKVIGSRLYVGYDTGEVRNIIPGVPQGRLSGITFGTSSSWDNFSVDIFNSRAVSLPSNMTKEPYQTWVLVSYEF